MAVIPEPEKSPYLSGKSWTGLQPLAGVRVPVWLAAMFVACVAVAGWWLWRLYDLQAGLELAGRGEGSWPPPRRVGVESPVAWMPGVLPWLGVGFVVVLGLMVGLAVRYPQSAGVWWLRSQWRRFTRYQPSWKRKMRLTGLSAKQDGEVLVPRIVKVRCGPFVERVLVKIVHGDLHDSFTKLDRSVALAHSFDAMRCSVQYTWKERSERGLSRDGKGGYIWLEFLRKNQLTKVVTALPIPRAEDIDLKAVPIGILEDGRPATIPLLGGHSLWGGMIGAGKSGGCWSAVRGVAPLIRDGTVQLWGADGKNGAELGIGRELFHHLIDNSPDRLEAMLKALCDEKDRRGVLLDGGLRKIEPSPDMPLIVVWLDEYAGTVAMLQDRQQAGRIMRFIGVLASQGRAMGIHLMACAQEPLAEVVKPRGYFSHRLAFRFMEDRYGDLVLGAGARARGARCDEIPQDQPGIFYMQVEDEISPRRGRCAWVDDDAIRAMAAEYAAPRAALDEPTAELESPAEPVAELQVPVSEPQAPPAMPAKARRPVDNGKHLPMTDEQDAQSKALLARWKDEHDGRIRHAVVTIFTVPKSNTSSDLRGWKIPPGAGRPALSRFDWEKGRLQAEFETALIQRGLDQPLHKTGQLLAMPTVRFGRQGRQEIPNYCDLLIKAFGDALWRSKDPDRPGWIVHDTDAEWRVLCPEIWRRKGPAMTTVRLWWKEPSA